MKRSHIIREIVEIVAIIVLFALVVHYVVQNFQATDTSMQPTFAANAQVMVNKTAYLFHPPERGDVIVFHFPQDTRRVIIRRVIGLPGDTIRTNINQIIVNGVVLNEPYVRMPVNTVAKVWKVPADSYYVLSDNRTFNDDSRTWDSVPKSYIVGKAVLIYWPMSNWQLVNTYSATYTQIVASQ
ncbi:MAG TPA: signal peptidase I [Ktedonosporobacter sp.]|nr:signal peptidase I [Ktedonosporobacter sp.]